jgi:hypothetical protein
VRRRLRDAAALAAAVVLLAAALAAVAYAVVSAFLFPLRVLATLIGANS